jgi:hypothetical protein
MRLMTNDELLVVAGGDMENIESDFDDSGDELDEFDEVGGGDEGDCGTTDVITDTASYAKCAIDATKAYKSRNPLDIASAAASCAGPVTTLLKKHGPDQLRSDKNRPYKANQD